MATIERGVLREVTETIEICDKCGTDVGETYGRLVMAGTEWGGRGNKFVLCAPCLSPITDTVKGQAE